MSIAKRSELIFLYDLSWGNPNGDPNDANKPRIDSETGINFVTDVRLKRTIRDELIARNYDVLIRDTFNEEDGTLKDAKNRGVDFLPESAKQKANKNNKDKSTLTNEELREFQNNVKRCVDIRMFGCVLPSEIKNASLQYTGPVQFKMGYSMHPVKLELVKGTGAFASGEGKDQKTFRQEYMLPYSLINFYGVINDRAAEITGLTEDDVKLLLDAMWYGTKNLITRTKAGQVPRLLINVAYKEKDFYIGELDKKVKFNYDIAGESVRSVKDGTMQLKELKDCLILNKEKIEKISIKMDLDLKTDINIVEELKNTGIMIDVIA
ncbi:type I-B CRISPR-associated protein Cas7/Csh2 [Sedimentibacter hydroxybenzoicus DSM 7310]|uniref:Type I-B CRISPR-associated protein Cas7/Csh2 n=1 Tax=Sedimentibacter hydroxybenzoicus DSM 7310 TaxID=1123245 RepID=A0A974GYC9_SEDHY|nr:type I-B CRISPR-associated protein Cas7/Csh2 [Sedimentibacter hydroxybenzoicus]NYB76120.1 type I-B CRISPR-associated protein Cas7/Csh2 [Sedimentibacter hydroxybenzoicus DSM 7310]